LTNVVEDIGENTFMAHTGTVLVLRVVGVDGGSPALTFTFSSVSARVGGLFVLRLFRRHAKEGSKREEIGCDLNQGRRVKSSEIVSRLSFSLFL
jgi:hypothetical protein